MDLDGGNPFIGAFEGVGPEISTFLGPNVTRYTRCYFRDQKSLDFRAQFLFFSSRSICGGNLVRIRQDGDRPFQISSLLQPIQICCPSDLVSLVSFVLFVPFPYHHFLNSFLWIQHNAIVFLISVFRSLFVVVSPDSKFLYPRCSISLFKGTVKWPRRGSVSGTNR